MASPTETTSELRNFDDDTLKGENKPEEVNTDKRDVLNVETVLGSLLYLVPLVKNLSPRQESNP